jgi:glycerol uptake facilitator-like aquaporin
MDSFIGGGPVVQILGGLAGAALAHAMFDLALVQYSTQVRTGTGIWIGEIIASFGLLITIIGVHKKHPEAVPYAVGLFITAGYWFTSSTSFANPAVTIARAFSDTFAGIRPEDIGGFLIAQIFGAVIATFSMRWFYPR